MLLRDERHKRWSIRIVGNQDDVIDRVVSEFVRSKRATRRDCKWEGRGPGAQVYDFHRTVAIARPKLVLLMDHENARWSRVNPAPLVSSKAADGIQEFI